MSGLFDRQRGRPLGSLSPTPSPVEIKRLANVAINAAMSEIMQAQPLAFPMEIAESIVREAALNLRTYKGANPTAEKLYTLADDIQGIIK